jgi:outer membrane immunogenic protein
MLNIKWTVPAAAVISAIVGISAAAAADLPMQTYTKAPVMVDPSYNWSGFYIGGHAGADFLRNAKADVDPADDLTASHFVPGLTNGAIPRSYSANGSGFVGGAQLGYNWQIRNYVYGLETDFSIPSAKAHQEIDTAVPDSLQQPAPTIAEFFGLVRRGRASERL